jgi:hypothetical protein
MSSTNRCRLIESVLSMVYTRRFFVEITSLDPFEDEDLLSGLEKAMPRTSIKLNRSSIVERRHL